MDGWSLRPAAAADADALARLRWAFRAELGQAAEAEAAFLERAAAWMAARLDEGRRWQAWLVEDDRGEAIGCAWLQLIEKVPNPGPEEELHGYVTSMYVAPAWRNRGIGAALLGAALDACRAAQVDSVILWPTSGSRDLYARHGFAAPVDVLELRIGTGRELP
ncbi:GNAT family N-acetyltransferase [Tepidiforma flava]|uniref:GNAT family N-acetyltransferase n=1 Tax=Tepidiforma flava TaxID=3004094 RepID=A0ABY7M992_9CHLR|nr:GNAT family N-acetyltransferase [Tepidiforma flava]WBL36619.1 GNAT family N-acetyltransferase [Tepidiforma flava]